MIINRRDLVNEKLHLIEDGYSAFTESKEVARMLKKELEKRNIDVVEDVTSIGAWFIPKKDNKSYMEHA